MIRVTGLAVACLTLFAPACALAQRASEAPGALMRGIDKITGEIYDLTIDTGQTAQLDHLFITLNSCRYPIGNPAGDAFASLMVTEAPQEEIVFSGWMIASSPALSAMEHPRYDIWVIRCTTS